MARIIAIGGLKGGTGKSTLSVNLACQFAGAMRVQLMMSIGKRVPTNGLRAACYRRRGIALPLDDQRGAAAWIRRVSAMDVEVVVIDLSPQIGAATAAALILADLFLIPVAPSALDLRAASKALDLLQEARARGEMGSQPHC
jgi:chromosome partitioning protein